MCAVWTKRLYPPPNWIGGGRLWPSDVSQLLPFLNILSDIWMIMFQACTQSSMKMVYLNCLKRSLCGHPELSNYILVVKTTHRINLGICTRSLSVYPVVNRNFVGKRPTKIQRDGASGRVLTGNNFPVVVRNFHTTQVLIQLSRDLFWSCIITI